MYQLGKENKIYRQLIKEKLPATGKKIAIVGAGPAGITAAYYLIRLGHEVTIYEAMPEAGGILRYGIPQYRLPKAVLKKELKLMNKLGIQFVFNTRLGKDLSLDDLKKDFDAVYLAIGAWKDIDLNIPGEDAKGVVAGTQILKELALGKTSKLGENVVVIGGGNVAIDSARSIWRLGKKVTVVYRRDKYDMPANKDEIAEAEAEKINFHFLSAPHEILVDEKGRVKGLKIEIMERGSIDSSGRRRPVPTGKFKEIACDSVVLAIGERVDSEVFAKEGLQVAKDGRIRVHPFTFQTSLDKVFAGGDAVMGPATAAEAMGMGKRAAASIDFILMNEKRFQLLSKKFAYKNAVPTDIKKSPKNAPSKLPVKDRIVNFHEVSAGVLMTNPPYGERIKVDDIDELYALIGERLKHVFMGYRAYILSYKKECFDKIGLKAGKRFPLFNGQLECEMREYEIFSGKRKEQKRKYIHKSKNDKAFGKKINPKR
jgi:NADH-quinone oxidoreductase subunit F